MDETRTAPHRAATRPQEALPDDAFELALDLIEDACDGIIDWMVKRG